MLISIALDFKCCTSIFLIIVAQVVIAYSMLMSLRLFILLALLSLSTMFPHTYKIFIRVTVRWYWNTVILSFFEFSAIHNGCFFLGLWGERKKKKIRKKERKKEKVSTKWNCSLMMVNLVIRCLKILQLSNYVHPLQYSAKYNMFSCTTTKWV